MFTVALFTVAKLWKQPKCPSTDEWIKIIWNIYTVEYYSTIRKEILPFTTARKWKQPKCPSTDEWIKKL